MRIIKYLILPLLFISAFGARADAPIDSAQIVERLLNFGEDGQIMLTYEDDKTTIKTIYIVAVIPLSSNYSKARAAKKAIKLAQISAEQTFVKFFNSNIKTSTSMQSKMRDTVDNAASNTTIVDRFNSDSKALISGLLKVASDPDRNGSYVAIYVWNNKVTNGVKKVSKSIKETAKTTLAE